MIILVSVNVVIPAQNKNYHPYSLVYITGDDIVEKKFEKRIPFFASESMFGEVFLLYP